MSALYEETIELLKKCYNKLSEYDSEKTPETDELIELCKLIADENYIKKSNNNNIIKDLRGLGFGKSQIRKYLRAK